MKFGKGVFSIAVAAIICLCATAQNQPSRLRLAMNDPIRTCGKAYPCGPEFVNKLDQVENGHYIDGGFTPGGALRLIDFAYGGKAAPFSIARTA